MKKITAIIEKANDGGYGIYAEDSRIPLFSNGMSEQEAKMNLRLLSMSRQNL